MQINEQLASLIGRPALGPRWAYGNLGSCMSLADRDDAQQRLADFARLCEEHSIPCSGYYLSSGYTLHADGKRCVFTWNRERIPDPKAMFDGFHDGGIRVIPNMKPWLLEEHPLFAQASACGALLGDPEASDGAKTPSLGQFWRGAAGTSGSGRI